MDSVRAHERDLTAYALERLEDVEGLRAFGPVDPDLRGGVYQLQLDGMHPHDIGELLRPRGRLRPHRPPLRPAADARDGRPRHRPRQLSRLQHRDDVDALIAALQNAREVFHL